MNGQMNGDFLRFQYDKEDPIEETTNFTSYQAFSTNQNNHNKEIKDDNMGLMNLMRGKHIANP